MAALPTFANEANALATAVAASATAAATSATNAANSATEAGTQATAAGASATAAAASATAAAASAADAAGAAIPEYTWAGKPAAAANNKKRIRITDVGPAPGLIFVSDNTRWIPDGVQVLASYATAVSGAADTNENTLATITVPAAILGIKGSLRILMETTQSGSSTKTFRIKLDGNALYTRGVTAAETVVARASIQNKGVTGTQSVYSFNETAALMALNPTTLSVDFTANKNLTITCQKGTGSDTMTLTRYIVEILP